MATKPKPKLEPIRAQDLASLDDENRHLMMQRSARSAPGFAYELSKTLPPGFAFKSRYDRLTSGRDEAAFEKAVGAGHLALARLWSARLRKAPTGGRDRGLESHHTGSVWAALMKLAIDSPASDAQIWRARGWLAQAATGRPLESVTPAHLAHEAVTAFCHGRPGLGLLCARQFLSLPPEELAVVTARGAEWPEKIKPGLWEEKRRSPRDFARELDSLTRSRDNEPEQRPKDCGLLAHLLYWSEATAASNPALSRELKDLESRLWERGAFAAPSRHAELFVAAPYGPDDPRARACQEAAHLCAGDFRHRGGYDHFAHGFLFVALLRRCATRPDAIGKDAAAWDAFVAAHPEAPQANPNPFAVWGTGSAALLSLAGDARLVEIGLDRGFKPDASGHWALVKPGVMQVAVARESLPPPVLAISLIDRKTALTPASVGLHPRKAAESKAKKGAGPRLKDGDPAKGLPKLEWPDKEDATDWTYQSFASLALASGQTRLARRLVQAGCPEATYAQALSEIHPSNRHELEALSARFEAESLFDATGGLEADHRSVKKVLKV